MREIKYRAWHGEAQEYCEGSTSNMFSWIDDGQPITLEQFTGLQDKKGVDIYEKDILESEGGFHFIVDIGGYFSKESVGNGVYYYQIGDEQYWAIESNPFGRENHFTRIGNIHENKELLCED
jgi:uncharacterized phage protein (TIGR01671 family)